MARALPGRRAARRTTSDFVTEASSAPNMRRDDAFCKIESAPLSS
jgi:hypothetical protein